MPCNQSKVTLSLGLVTALLLLADPCPTMRAQGVVAVPNSLFSAEGNTNNFYPFWVFWPYTGRYQQVYAASQFSTISNGTQDDKNYFSAMTNGGWISDIYFRFHVGTPPFSATVSNVEIHLSTSQRQSDGLSSVFSDNVGLDDTMVFSGSLRLANVSSSEYDTTHVALKTNFWYNPKLGNLLLDVSVYQGVNSLPGPLDAVAVVGDSVSSVSSTNETSGSVDTRGLVTFFAMAPPPILQDSITNFATPTNYFVVTWPFTQPTGFVLQVSSTLGSNAVWQTVPGTLNTNIAAERFQFPIDTGASKLFFRCSRAAGP